MRLMPDSTPAPASPIASPELQRIRLRRMQALAVGLLVLALACYLGARVLESSLPAAGYLRAFAEAALIGGLADWFAVTALFRHPLGVPVPHTAILPTRKARIADTLGAFVERNFLNPELIATHLEQRDPAQMAARWLLEHQGAARVAAGAASLLPQVLGPVSDERMQRFLAVQARLSLRRVDVAPLAGDVLDLVTAEGRHHDVVDEIVRQAGTLLRDYEPLIRDRVRERTAWLWQKIGLDERVSDRLIAAIEETLDDIAADPEHAWRTRFRESLDAFIRDLKESPEYARAGRRLMTRLLAHPVVAEHVGAIWEEVRRRVAAMAESPDSAMRARIQKLLEQFAQSMLADPAAREALNEHLRALVLSIAASQQSRVAEMIADTVKRWDTRTFVERIELAIGRDLQYIRINGMVVGGIIGVVIHTLNRWLAG